MKRLTLIALVLVIAAVVFHNAAKTTKAATETRNAALVEVLAE